MGKLDLETQRWASMMCAYYNGTFKKEGGAPWTVEDFGGKRAKVQESWRTRYNQSEDQMRLMLSKAFGVVGGKLDGS